MNDETVRDSGLHDGKCEVMRMQRTLDVLEAVLEGRGLSQADGERKREEIRSAFHDGKCRCAERRKNHDDFIRLWTAAGSAANYDKEAWKNVEGQLFSAGVI